MTSEIISSIYVEVEVEEGEDRMKKVLSVLLILALVFGLAACGGGETAEEPAGDEAMKVGFIYIGTKNVHSYYMSTIFVQWSES